jgi:molybdenum cofactor biosynthesis enzyme MoaA
MCYFTDENYVKTLKGVFPKEELNLFAKSILKRAIKLQIGCGTEPTLYKNLTEIIALGKAYKVPYISMTTNANTITKEKLESWCANGLNEITVSLHGVNKETYEEMMGKGDFDKFIQALKFITEIKNTYPNFQLRINYTFNQDNFEQLAQFWEIFGEINIDALQIRPIKKMGDTSYNNFSMEKVIPKYLGVYNVLREECKTRNTLFLAPSLDQLKSRQSESSIVHNYTYCYISPTFFWREGYDWKKETFNNYSSRTKWNKEIFLKAFASRKELQSLENESLNYEVI